MILDEKAIKEKWESPCTDSSINPDSPFAFDLEIAHAQARAIMDSGNELCVHQIVPPLTRLKRECLLCSSKIFDQLSAELREGK